MNAHHHYADFPDTMSPEDPPRPPRIPRHVSTYGAGGLLLMIASAAAVALCVLAWMVVA